MSAVEMPTIEQPPTEVAPSEHGIIARIYEQVRGLASGRRLMAGVALMGAAGGGLGSCPEPANQTCGLYIAGHSYEAMTYNQSPNGVGTPEQVVVLPPPAELIVELGETVYPGWTAAQIIPPIREHLAQPPETDKKVVLIDGFVNEVIGDGELSPAEAQPYRDLAEDFPEADFVFVSPAYTEFASALHQQGLEQVRAEIDDIAADYPNVRVLDRREVVTSNDVLDDDGIHPNAPDVTWTQVLAGFVFDGRLPVIRPETRLAFQAQNNSVLPDNCVAPPAASEQAIATGVRSVIDQIRAQDSTMAESLDIVEADFMAALYK